MSHMVTVSPPRSESPSPGKEVSQGQNGSKCYSAFGRFYLGLQEACPESVDVGGHMDTLYFHLQVFAVLVSLTVCAECLKASQRLKMPLNWWL